MGLDAAGPAIVAAMPAPVTMRAHSRAMPESSFSLIALHQVRKRFDSGLEALRDMSLEIRVGEFVALLGPSGCGKSTALRLVAGLDAASAGVVRSPALDSNDPADAGGDTAFVFQEPTLMPWASVFDNVRLPLRLRGQSRAACEAAVRAVLASVGLSDFERAYPAQLSGGMKMRASIARALVTRPRVLLMDEPFAALDDITRQKLNGDLLQWWAEQHLAALFVTHSVAEAVFLAQRVLVMSARPGRVVAEVAIDEAYPRVPAFRTSQRFADHCRHLAEALAFASQPA
jgi:NitT/TauT family transport system ATP-binding protein